MSIYNALIKKTVIPTAELVSGIHFSKYLKELNKTQWLSSDEIKKLQEKKLREIIRNAYENVPYYHRAMKDKGLNIEDIKTISDLKKLPILTKQDIKKHIDQFVSKKYTKKDLVHQSSSGSTGEPFEYYVTKIQKGIKWAFAYRTWLLGGYDIGDRIAHIQGFPNFAFKNNKFLRKLESKICRFEFYSSFDIYEHNIENIIQEIKKSNPKYIRGYPSSISFLAKHIKSLGYDIKLEGVLTTGETITKTQRKIIEDTFYTSVFDAYGGENICVSGECSAHIGQHINSEKVIVEVVDSDGNSVAPGERGEIILTNLTAFAMPFIRYNIKDIGIHSDEKCSCGRGLPLLKSIEGRLSDVFVTSEGKLIVVHFFTGLFEHMPSVNMFQIIQKTKEYIVVKIVKNSEFTNKDMIYIEKSIKDYVGNIKIDIDYVNDIPITKGGKRRFFISEVSTEYK